MKKNFMECITLAIIGALIGLVIVQGCKINDLEAEHSELVHGGEAGGIFYCQDCNEYYNKYCEVCGQNEELWNKYYNEFSVMNYCEQCDTCYYAYCECTSEYDYQDYETFVYEHESYVHSYCTNYCSKCDEYYYDHCCGCEGHDGYIDDYKKYIEYLCIGHEQCSL